MLNRILIKQLWPISLILVVIILAYWLSFRSPSPLSKQCSLDDGICLFQLDNEHQLRIEFDHYPLQIEEELTLSIQLPNAYKFTDTWIEGVNMFMGKMRVIEQTQSITEQGTLITAITFLGACSEPQMRWRMIVELEHSVAMAGQNDTASPRQRYFINFMTST